MLPSHLLSVSTSYGEPRLVNRGTYMTTDYDEFKRFLIQTKALERADEWYYAKQDYMRAFKLIRGTPFDRMYDNWSEERREAILNKIEKEARDFAEHCAQHNDREYARAILQRMSSVVKNAATLKKIA